LFFILIVLCKVKMGNHLTLLNDLFSEVRELREQNEFMRKKLEKAYERMGKLEKNVINVQTHLNLMKSEVTNLNIVKSEVKYLSNRLLNIDLLEEGRSKYIGNRKRHTYSSYTN